jgi:oligoendopeptidase F
MQRQFIKKDFSISTWELLKPYFEDLKNRTIVSRNELERWLLDNSELSAVVSENMAWRYIKMTCDTTDENLRKSYNDFVENIEPNMAPLVNDLNEKLMACPFITELDEKIYGVYLRTVKNSLDLFREENIALNTALQQKEQQYGAITGAQSISYNGETMTLQKAGLFLKSLNRKIREEVYHLTAKRRAEDENTLNNLFSELIELRHKVAVNTGFRNYRDYKHQALGRFDYKVSDCLAFHESVKQYAVPLMRQHDEARKKALKLEDYRPWDISVDETGQEPLKPFSDAKELVEKTITCFNQIDSYFGECVRTMDKMGRLDLESRLGKAPGGYQYPLYETDVPFIFMNSVGLHRDLVTMVHEGGHAIHSFLYNHLDLVDFKNPPSEVAELASMSMELISMEHWDVFFTNKEELKRAKCQQLEGVMDTLPWIAAVDKFQHWLYENPLHTVDERYQTWIDIMHDFGNSLVNYAGLEANLKRRWQVQLHLFEVPFYYIEYGFAQLGAIAMWRQYKQNPEQAVANYKKALALGYTKSIPAIYEAAGIRFDFSPAYVEELMAFVKEEYVKIKHN